MNISKPVFTILYENVNITKDISDSLISIHYTDNTEGHSDTVEIVVDDTFALWQNGWYPQKGSQLQLMITDGNSTLNCGTFNIDEVKFSSPADIITIKAIAASNTGTLRTKKSSIHEQKTLQQIVTTIAENNGLTVFGKFDQAIYIDVAVQNRETDLAFLHRLSDEYGFVFSLRGTQITFYQIYDLENIPAVSTIDKTECKNIDIVDKSIGTYSNATSAYTDPNTGNTTTATITNEVLNADNIDFTEIVGEDTLKVYSKATNSQQAQAKAKAALYKKNSYQQEGDFTLPGRLDCIAGNTVSIAGIGSMSGNYHIFTSTHKIVKAGWDVDIRVKRVGFVQKVYTKKPKKPRPFSISVVN